MFANKLGDLDDFLAPSLECIKPLMPSNKGKLDLNEGEWKIDASDTQMRPNLIKSGADKIASITL